MTVAREKHADAKRTLWRNRNLDAKGAETL